MRITVVGLVMLLGPVALIAFALKQVELKANQTRMKIDGQTKIPNTIGTATQNNS
jgi:hypothetical protein